MTIIKTMANIKASIKTIVTMTAIIAIAIMGSIKVNVKTITMINVMTEKNTRKRTKKIGTDQKDGNSLQ